MTVCILTFCHFLAYLEVQPFDVPSFKKRENFKN